MKWQETTIRKGTKKICRDMFITKYGDTWQFVHVKNGRVYSKYEIVVDYAKELIADNNLVKTRCDTFKRACTYRTKESTRLVGNLLN